MTLKFIHLTEKNAKDFSKKMKKSEHNLVFFLADWCGHCQSFKPTLNNLISHLKKNTNIAHGNIVIACDKTMHALDIKKPAGFPTISLYKNLTHIKDYSAPRTVEHLAQFIKSHMKISHHHSSKKHHIRHARRGRHVRRGRHSRRAHHTRKNPRRKRQKNTRRKH